MKYKYLFVFLIFGFLYSCKTEPSKKNSQENRKVKIPAFSGQNAYDLVKAQVDMGTREPGSPGAKQAITWMKDQLTSVDWQVEEQTFKTALFTGQEVKGTNIIGRYNPDVKERVMLCAHWDSRMIADKDSVRKESPIPGANDGASGVGVIIELAKTIAKHPIPMGVDIVFFDLEDQGSDQGDDEYSWCLGSQYFAKHLPDDPYEVKYAILLDMVGAKNAKFPKEGYSMNYASQVVNKVWGVAKLLKKDNYFVNKEMKTGITDDHRFLIQYAQIPAIDIIHYEKQKFMKEHHTHADDMSIIDKNTLGAVGQVVLATLYKESNKEF